jgi:hypothetical protein
MGVRMSQLAKCPRMAAYGALDTLEDERAYDPEEAYFRGKVYEAVAAERLRTQYGAEFEGEPNVQRQVVIPWELGEGHADCYVRSIRKLVECKSSISDSDIPMMDAIAQAGMYFARHPEAETCEVWWFDPRRNQFKPTRIPVERPDPDVLAAKIDSVRQALDGGPLPARVCSHPKKAPEHLCPFTGTCFSTWAEPVERIQDTVVAELAEQWLGLKLQEALHADKAKAYQADRKEIEEQLRELVPVGKSDAEDFRVSRIEVGESYSLPLKQARASGLWNDMHDEVFGQLISRRRGHERFSIERVGDKEQSAADDAGDVPF